jgi:apolipoprotein N-acyltransferase
MSSLATMAEKPGFANQEQSNQRLAQHPVLQAVASALLLWLAFPPVDAGHLVWLALVPLFLIVQETGRRSRSYYLAAWAGGQIFWMLAIEWVRRTDPSAWLAWVAMASFLALWWPLFLFLARWGTLRLRLPLMLVAPTAWVALEFVRAHALTGFPWYFLAHSQYRYPVLIQTSDLVGVYGLSFAIALLNAFLVEMIRGFRVAQAGRGGRISRRILVRGAAVLAILGGIAGYGVLRTRTADFRPGPRLALLQSNLTQELKMSRRGEMVVQTYIGLIDRALESAPAPDLIVWPETSFPYKFITFDPKLGEEALAALVRKVTPKETLDDWKREQEAVNRILHTIADRAGVPMVVGGTTNDFTPEGFARYNSALLIRPNDRTVAHYHKLHLVPFGEYVPLLQTFPWLTRLTPYHDDYVPSLVFGKEPKWLDQGGVRYATAICFEDSVPHVVRRFFAEAPDGRQPDVLLNISNDGWFHGSAELDSHLAVSVFRAVENRVPMARAVNTGISALIDGNGKILAQLPKLKEEVLIGVVPLDDRRSFYSIWGDWFAVSLLLLTLAMIPASFLRRRSTETLAS